MAKKVTVIKAVSGAGRKKAARKLKVCGYARVSTGSKAQAGSYATQVAYYTEKIEANPLWEFAGVYADEGITGTKTKGRNEFKAMIAACEDGEVELILTKSITRFARNTVECIQTIRKLKAMGVGIYFEKENINTLHEASELMLTILASVAQGESEDFSGNNRWSIVNRFENGAFKVGTPAYGYRKDEEGNLLIEETEVETVRWIFESYLNGMGTYRIAKKLNEQGVPTIRYSEKWQDSVIKEILNNPIYEGDSLHQRTYTERNFPFERKVNNGQLPMYLQKDAHPAIITHEEAEAVRSIMEYRNKILHIDGDKYQNRYLFSSRIICGECGSTFRRQKIYIGKPHEKIIWTCHNHVENIENCKMKAIREDAIHQAFVTMWNKLCTNQGIVLEPMLKALMEQAENRSDTKEMEQLNTEIHSLSEQSQILNQVMKKGYMDSALFMEKSNLLAQQLTECRRKKTMLNRRQKRTKEIVRTEQLLTLLKEEGYQREFKEELFDLTVKEIRISKSHAITFCLKNGLKLTEKEGGEKDAVAHTHRI
ncbi:recombinase family protein [Clostridium porci]|uniref:Recombinase family protein n=1 Tax=Clostridium porci TaxID=2605778 RepID=A0A7X2NPG1_9CLOT|nr:recombinase family protein [Clostridium porci]MSS38493.1 recombinase family protein [Clostridium porci]